MKKLSLLSLFLLAAVAHATTTAYSPPVGGMTIPAAATTDNFVSVALTNPAAWVGTVASVSGSDITVSGTPGWGTNAFASGTYYYVRMLSGAQKGHFFSITANGSGDVTIDNAGLNLSVINPGDTMEIVQYWTLGTLYPASQAGVSFTASPTVFSIKTQMLFFDATSTGINRSASAIYFFLNGHWRKVGDVSNSYDNTIIFPDTYFVQRNSTSATVLTCVGRVQPGFLGTILTATSSVQNDNFVALAYPVNVTLSSSGLASSGFTATTSVFHINDEILWFDPSSTGINHSANAIYFYYNNAWRKVGDVANDYGATVLPAGSGFIIRKAANGATSAWVFSTGI
jgi:uncharacterized protein (TIGR02597 family)